MNGPAQAAATDRRGFLRKAVVGAAAVAVAGPAALSSRRSGAAEFVWQVDPAKCTQCGQCATHCVLNPSAVKCVHAYALCGYCRLCFGYFQPTAVQLDEGAENQLCPTGAIRRRFVEDPYYQYTIDESLCVGCGKCVKGCNLFGNGSLFLQVRHDRCVHCNECAIARDCPSGAIRRIPASQAYLLKTPGGGGAAAAAVRDALPAAKDGAAGVPGPGLAGNVERDRNDATYRL